MNEEFTSAGWRRQSDWETARRGKNADKKQVAGSEGEVFGPVRVLPHGEGHETDKRIRGGDEALRKTADLGRS